MDYGYFPPLERWQHRENGDLVFDDQLCPLSYPFDSASVSMTGAEPTYSLPPARRVFTITRVGPSKCPSKYRVKVENELRQEVFIDDIHGNGKDEAYDALRKFYNEKYSQQVFHDAKCKLETMQRELEDEHGIRLTFTLEQIR